MCILCRYARLHQLSEERAQKLEDSKKLQQFLRDVDEVSCVCACVRACMCVCVCVHDHCCKKIEGMLTPEAHKRLNPPTK